MTPDAPTRRVWHLLPERLRASQTLRSLKRAHSSRAHHADASEPDDTSGAPGLAAERSAPRAIRNLDELHEMLVRLDEAARVSDDELRRLFKTFVLEFELRLPDDPYSEAYRRRIFEVFHYIRGEAYDPSNERTPIDLDTCVTAPFPYATRSAETVGNQLMAIGHLIKAMALAPESRVLELGSGWGNAALAQMGHSVTTLDIDPSMARLVAERARRLGITVETHVGDFMSARELGRRFDAVLFVASFHHAADHLALLAALDGLVHTQGTVVFCAEPISDALPAPWCLRLDGESLWQIRRRGWLELGFQEGYFLATLRRFGWKTERSVCGDTPFGVVYVARRLDDDAPLTEA